MERNCNVQSEEVSNSLHLAAPPPGHRSGVGVADRFWLFIFTLNRAKTWFNSIFNSKLNQEYSFNKIIHSNWKTKHSLRKQWKTGKRVRSVQKIHFYSFFLWKAHFFYSFSNSFYCTAKIFIQRIYSFKRESEIFIKIGKINSKNYSIQNLVHFRRWSPMFF